MDTVDLFDPPAYLYAICGQITSWIKCVAEGGGWKMFTRFIIKMVIILSGPTTNIIIITNYIAGTL